MSSKNTGNYESQNRSFRYTLLAILGVLIVVAILAYALRAMNGGTVNDQEPLDPGVTENHGGDIVDGGQQYDDPGNAQDMDVSKTVPADKPPFGSVPAVDSREQSGGEQSGEAGLPEKRFVTPVEGASVLKEFSEEIPLYSVTLEQYVTHIGVDYEAPADSQVRAVAEGTVTAVYQDDRLGVTIEIDHGEGLVSKYSNLSTMELVEEGDVVKRGQVISGVGNSALFETLDPEHLHFELWKDGKALNPAEHI